jgi:hypothetical protein
LIINLFVAHTATNKTIYKNTKTQKMTTNPETQKNLVSEIEKRLVQTSDADYDIRAGSCEELKKILLNHYDSVTDDYCTIIFEKFIELLCTDLHILPPTTASSCLEQTAHLMPQKIVQKLVPGVVREFKQDQELELAPSERKPPVKIFTKCFVDVVCHLHTSFTKIVLDNSLDTIISYVMIEDSKYSDTLMDSLRTLNV